MNALGIKYCKEQSRKVEGRGFKSPNEERIIERVMRLGVEARRYELETPGVGSFDITDDLRRVAVATFQEDYAPY